MKNLLVALCLGLCTVFSMNAQVASTICLEEVQVAYKQIDASQVLKEGPGLEVTFEHSYVMRSDPKRATVSGEETLLMDKGFVVHETPEGLVVSDASEAFNWRQNQFVVYRTRPSLEKAGLIPRFDAGIFEHCLVRECHFVPAPGDDSISFKRAFMTVDAEGQKKYQISELEFITNPHDTTLISIKVNFVAPSLYIRSAYELKSVLRVSRKNYGAADVFLDEEGELKKKFDGAGLMDYR